MYAVIANGGKQYKVAEGQTIKLESINIEAGKELELDQILLLVDGENTIVGTPFLSNVTIMSEIVAHGRNDKINIIKFGRRKHRLKRMGHRQNYTILKIIGINVT